MSSEQKNDGYQGTGEFGSSIWLFYWNNTSLTVRLFLLLGLITGAVGSFFFQKVPYWFTLGILAGTVCGLLAGGLVEAIKAVIHEITHPAKIPGLMPCPHCRKGIRIPEEWLGRNVKCPHCCKVFTAPNQVDMPGGKDDIQVSRAEPPATADRPRECG